MQLKELTEQEALFIILENAKEEGLDLSSFQDPLFSILKRMYYKGLGLSCWQGSQAFSRFGGRGVQTLYPVPPQPQAPIASAPYPSQPGVQPIRQAPPNPPPAPPMQNIPGRSMPPHPVPRQAPVYPIPNTGMPPTAPTAPPNLRWNPEIGAWVNADSPAPSQQFSSPAPVPPSEFDMPSRG